MVKPDAQSMCIIAFGMGSSYRSALQDGLNVEAVELVPSVPSMFKYFYPDWQQVMANPKGHVIIADGRNHVELTNHTYDLLMVDPPPPMNTSGTAVLFSQEFYAAARSRLNPGGVMMQWVYSGSGLTVDELRSHAKTFKSVFPHVTIVFSPMAGANGVLMLGSDDPITLTPAGIESVSLEVRRCVRPLRCGGLPARRHDREPVGTADPGQRLDLRRQGRAIRGKRPDGDGRSSLHRVRPAPSQVRAQVTQGDQGQPAGGHAQLIGATRREAARRAFARRAA